MTPAWPGRGGRTGGVLVLTWNLFHGRSVPSSGRPLLREFADCLAAWDWDVALLQEVPPWWPDELAGATGASARAALTSRNAAAPLRRAIARRRPDLLGANGGGANAILARMAIIDHDVARLRVYPERRVAQLVRLAGGIAVVNLHASRRPALAAAEFDRVCALAAAWAPTGPLVIGGDFNLRTIPPAPGRPPAVAGSGVDHVLARGLRRVGAPLEPPRLPLGGGAALSDHAPLIVRLD